ncbi:MAG TPA: hypothetical protein VEY11_02635 [Pyrinomonadaceae bacterium]|nr:hypothetical protein [Pyrinomonadaceae bacterium]
MVGEKGTAKDKKPSLAGEGTTDSAKEEIVRADLSVLKSERGLITDIQKSGRAA